MYHPTCSFIIDPQNIAGPKNGHPIIMHSGIIQLVHTLTWLLVLVFS